jgi:hypothetical protein
MTKCNIYEYKVTSKYKKNKISLNYIIFLFAPFPPQFSIGSSTIGNVSSPIHFTHVKGKRLESI